MRRVLAFVAAAAMVVGGIVVRDRLDDDDDGNGSSGGRLRLTCATELSEVCQTIADLHDDVDVTVEPAGVTADRLSASSNPDAEGWLVAQPWPAIVADARSAAGLPSAMRTGEVLARSPLVIAMWKDRAAVLQPACGGPVGWRCLGDAARKGHWRDLGGREEWGLLKPAHTSPDQAATGLLVLGQAVSGYFGRNDLASADLEDDGFRGWFAALERAIPPRAFDPTVDAVRTMLSQGRGAFDAVGTTEAVAGPLVANSARGSDITLLYPSPMATADIVLATVAEGTEGLRQMVIDEQSRKALAASGWRVPGVASISGVGRQPLPRDNALPSPGLLAALRGAWREVAA